MINVPTIKCLSGFPQNYFKVFHKVTFRLSINYDSIRMRSVIGDVEIG